MNSPSSVSSSLPFPLDDDEGDDPRLLAVVKEYQAEWETGRRPSRAAYMARHPELAPALTVYLDSIDLLHSEAVLSGTGRRASRLDTGLAAGDRLGEFELIREIGRGGMGVVYEAQQASLGRRVAVKVLPAAFAANRARLQRFTVEAQAAAAVAHPNIVTVFAVGEDRGTHYYAMKLVDGVPLDRLAASVSSRWDGGQSADGSSAVHRPSSTHSHPPSVPRPSSTDPAMGPLVALHGNKRAEYLRRIARIGAEVARALDHAHQCGVVHRDVKPANLLYDRDGRVWVTDFGLAQLADGPAVTRTGNAVGTLRYMSPEQAAGDRRRLDHRTDVYSLGATLYELMAGRPAFPTEEPAALLRQIANDDPTPPRAIEPEMPIDLETVVLKSLQKDLRDRYPTAGELADDLDHFLAGQPVRARRPSPWDRAKRWASRHPATVAAALLSLLIVVIASGGATALVLREQSETERAYRKMESAYVEAQREHQAADTARKAADEFAAAEEHARKDAEKRADEAQQRFRRAKELGDLILRISEEEMGTDRPFQGPRRRLLLAALENSRWLLAGGHGDPAIRAELDRVVKRVERLLAEQDLRWEADGAFLMKFPNVQTELKLTPEQIRHAERAFPPGWMKGPSEKGGPTRTFDPRPETKIELIRSLNSTQRQRLRQISIQFRGPNVFIEPDMVDALGLSYPQRESIKLILAEERGPFGLHGKSGPKPAARSDADARSIERIIEVLTPEQQEAWRKLRGEPFAAR